MSNLTNKTEYKAFSIIGQIEKQFERFYYLDMSASDD